MSPDARIMLLLGTTYAITLSMGDKMGMPRYLTEMAAVRACVIVMFTIIGSLQ